MEIIGYFLYEFDIILNTITSIKLIIVFIFLIIFYHFFLFLIRDIKYVKAFKKYKDPKKIVITDLKNIPLLNIIIPAWNEGETFRQCLISITKLGYPKLNVIINAGGNKETLKIANYFKKFDYFTIESQKPGGKIKAINECFSHISEGIVYIVDADVYLEDETVLRMVYPLINQDENVVIGGVRPLKSQQSIDLVNYLSINENLNFRHKFSRYGKRSISGANTALKYQVIKDIKQFSEDEVYAVERTQGEDILSKGYRIYRLTDFNGRLNTEFPHKIGKWIRQKIRWNENYLVFSYQHERINLAKFLIIFLISIYLLVFPFLFFFHPSLVLIGLFILFSKYLKKLRRIIYTKLTEIEYFNKLKIAFFIKIIFYIYIEALTYIFIFFESIFKGSKNLEKRKNL